MYVLDLIKSLLRRWYFLVIGVLITGALATAAFLTVSPSYDTKSTMLLLPPKSSVGTRGNPYLYLGGLAQAVEVLSFRMNTPQVRQPIESAHPDASIDIGQDTTATGPILAVTVSAKTEAEARSSAQDVLEQVPTVLQQMQDQLTIPDASRITVIGLTPDAEVEMVTRNRDRAVIGIVGVGLAGTLLITGFIDGLLLGRIGPRRRPEPAPGWKVAAKGPDPDADGQGSGSATPTSNKQPITVGSSKPSSRAPAAPSSPS